MIRRSRDTNTTTDAYQREPSNFVDLGTSGLDDGGALVFVPIGQPDVVASPAAQSVAATVTTLVGAPVSDTATNADGSRLYVALSDGDVATYDAFTGQLLGTVHVGSYLAGIDVSPDGSYLLVVEDSRSVGGDIIGVVHKINLATNTVTDFSMPFYSIDGPFHDVAIFDNGRAIVTTKLRGSGSTTTYTLDTATGTFAFLTSGSAQAGIVMASADRRHIALTDGFNVGGPNQLYGLAANGTVRLDASRGTASTNNSIAAYAGDGSMLAYLERQYGLNVYDNQLNKLTTVAGITGQSVAGVAFDATGDFLYVLLYDHTVQKISTTDWSVVETLDIGNVPMPQGFGYGSGEVLTVGPDSAYLLYNSGTFLYRIENPTAVVPVEGSALSETLTGTALIDLLHGNDGDDTLLGNGGDDILRGGAGNDVLDGGTGHDAMYGGTGNDIYYVDDARDLAVEIDNASGTDEVISSVSYAIGPNIEKLTLTGTGNIDATGNSLDNILTGNAGNNLLNGMGGADQMVGGAGNDTYWIENASDQAIELANEGNDTVNTTRASLTLAANLENLIFVGTGSFTGIGNELDNMITGGTFADSLTGGAGNDVLNGGNGSDVLDGGEGADTMTGGIGNDIFYVDSTADSVIEAVGAGNDEVRTTLGSFTLGITAGSANVERLTGLLGTGQTLTGNSGSNIVTGGGGNDTLIGGGGSDSLRGSAGDDRLIVGAGGNGSVIDGGADTDTLVVTGAVTLGGLAGIEAIEFQSGGALTLSASQFTTGLAPNATLSGTGAVTINMGASDFELYLQQLVGGSGVTITVNGSASGDVIKGAVNAVNIINGGDGADSIRGSTQADILDGGDGNDKIEGGMGADILTGGAGADTFRYQSVSASGLGVNADRITDFVSGTDKLGFALLDANPGTPAIDPFSYIDTQAFHATGAGEIRYETSGADLMVQIDINGDGIADMAIYLNGLGGGALTSGDFVI